MTSINKHKYLVVFFLVILLLFLFQYVGYGESNTATEQNKVKEWVSQFLNTKEQIQIASLHLNGNKQLLIVSSVKSEETLGYIVLLTNADSGDEQNIEVLEYGVGSYIPYLPNIITDEDFKTLSETTLVYQNPLESYWQLTAANETVYIDGSTGEWLPDISSYQPNKNNKNYFSLADKITESYLNKELIFDPFTDLTWLVETTKDASLSKADLVDLLNNDHKILFSGSKYDNLVQFAYPIIGYQLSDKNLYVAIYDEYLDLIRYISFDELNNYGQLIQI